MRRAGTALTRPLLGVAAVALLVTGCTQAHRVDDSPRRAPAGSTDGRLTAERRAASMKHVVAEGIGRQVGTVEELVAISDLVVRGTVSSTGRAGFKTPGGTPRQVEVDVSTTYFSSGAAAPEHVSVVVNLWTARDVPMLMGDEPWFERGDDVLLFLARDDGGLYSPDSAASAFLLADDEVQGAHSTEAAAKLVGQPIADGLRLVEAAAAQVRTGAFSLQDTQTKRREAQVSEVAKQWTSKPAAIATGDQSGQTWVMNYAPTKDGFCWAADFDNPPPISCVSLDTVKRALSLSKNGVVAIRQDSPALLYGVTDPSVRSLTGPAGATVETRAAPDVDASQAAELPRYFVVDLAGVAAGPFEVCTSRGCQTVGAAAGD